MKISRIATIALAAVSIALGSVTAANAAPAAQTQSTKTHMAAAGANVDMCSLAWDWMHIIVDNFARIEVAAPGSRPDGLASREDFETAARGFILQAIGTQATWGYMHQLNRDAFGITDAAPGGRVDGLVTIGDFYAIFENLFQRYWWPGGCIFW
ncbi:hypothetical protein [Amycolatopsis sp. lyj-23]|uniref:hypothetical protein n=1 Tax=Amycolatopsis sp. lyj-23 TaxID=2789283 RepID=UPI003979A676